MLEPTVMAQPLEKRPPIPVLTLDKLLLDHSNPVPDDELESYALDGQISSSI